MNIYAQDVFPCLFRRIPVFLNEETLSVLCTLFPKMMDVSIVMTIEQLMWKVQHIPRKRRNKSRVSEAFNAHATKFIQKFNSTKTSMKCATLSIRFSWKCFQFRLVRSIISQQITDNKFHRKWSTQKSPLSKRFDRKQSKKRKIIATKLSSFYYGEPIFAHFIISFLHFLAHRFNWNFNIKTERKKN